MTPSCDRRSRMTDDERNGLGFELAGVTRFRAATGTSAGSAAALSPRADGRRSGRAQHLADPVAYRLSRVDRLQTLWPALAAMEHRDDLQMLAAYSVPNDVRCAWNHELTRRGHPTGTSEIRQLCQAIDRRE